MNPRRMFFIEAEPGWKPRSPRELENAGVEILLREGASNPELDAWNRVSPPWNNDFRERFASMGKIFLDWRDQGALWPALLLELEKRGLPFLALIGMKDILESNPPDSGSFFIPALLKRGPSWLFRHLLIETSKDFSENGLLARLRATMELYPFLQPYQKIEASAWERHHWAEPEFRRAGSERPWLSILPWPAANVEIEEWKEAARAANFPEDQIELVWTPNADPRALPAFVASRLAARAEGQQLFFVKSPGALTTMAFSDLVNRAPRAQVHLGPGTAAIFRPTFLETGGLAPAGFSFAHAFEAFAARAWTCGCSTRNLVSGNAIFVTKSVTDLLIQRLWGWNSDLTDPHPAG